MINVTQVVKGDQLIITVDLSKAEDNGLTKSEKSWRVASTLGSSRVDGHEDISFNLNVYKKVKK